MGNLQQREIYNNEDDYLKMIYKSNDVEKVCTSVKAANALFGGNKPLAMSLLSRINAIQQAENIKDIIVQPAFHFHKLENKGGKEFRGYFAIDVKSRREPWRIVLEPLDGNEEPFDPCNIDEIASAVRVIKIMEVSNHYE
jgi:plasmid maintenance system killer protein